MIAEVVMGAVGLVGAASGVAALVFVRKQNGNGKHNSPSSPPNSPLDSPYSPPVSTPTLPLQVQWPPELADLTRRITDGLEAIREAATKNPPEPVWATQIVQDLERINDRMSEPATAMLPPELTVGLDRVTQRLEMLLEIPPPEPPDFGPVATRLEALVASMPRPQPELAETLAELPHRIGELFAAARKGKDGPRHIKGAGCQSLPLYSDTAIVENSPPGWMCPTSRNQPARD